MGFEVGPEECFDTVTVEVGPYQGLILKNAVDNGLNLRAVGDRHVGITVDERTRPETLLRLYRAFGGYHLEYNTDYPEYRLPKALAPPGTPPSGRAATRGGTSPLLLHCNNGE